MEEIAEQTEQTEQAENRAKTALFSDVAAIGANVSAEAKKRLYGAFTGSDSGQNKAIAGALKAGSSSSVYVTPSAAKYKLSYWVARIVQAIFWPFFYVGYRACFSMRIKGKEKLKGVKGPVIFVSNHIGVFDSFIFDLFVPPFTAIPPFRFMGTKDFIITYLNILKYIGVIDLIYILFGVFKVTYGQGAEKALVPAYDIIKNGGTVAIFPEGKVWMYDKYGIGHGEKEPIGPFKWGAAILAKNTGALVVPVSFKQHSRNMFRDYLDINIGEPYRVNKASAPEVLTQEMRGRVVGLYREDL